MPLSNFLRRLDRLRRRSTLGLATRLNRWLGHSRHLTETRLPNEDVRQILVVRNNKRIGNMYFLLPFIREVRHAYPNAQIDLMIIHQGQSRIFLNLGLRHTFVSQFAFATFLPFLKTMRKVRHNVYDLLLMPHNSASDTLICAFIHARNKVAFHDGKTVGVFRHAIQQTPASHHAALSPLTILSALGHSVGQVSHTIEFTEREQEKAWQTVSILQADAPWCFAYFRGARGNKIIDDATWHTIRQKFDEATHHNTQWVEILSPDITTPLTPETVTFASADLRELGAVLSAMDLFVCGDTGPLHLADAANARCVGLYTATSPIHYGVLNDKSINVTDIDNLDAQAIVRQITDSRASNNT
ncbi:glycosyltransferase family 9 protein [Orrella sp. 11846]|uniref:glycosyltransferase family 9 protein n=1 Tax=Orrella sp. 11846 TaxID=3409913 RepID=UPI003B5A1F4C